MDTEGVTELAVLLLLFRPKANERAEAIELMELRRCIRRSVDCAFSCTEPSTGSGLAASGSGITISSRRSCFGILAGAILPASLPTLDLGNDDRLPTDCE